MKRTEETELSNDAPLNPKNFQKHLPEELLRLYRGRSGLSQAELATSLGLKGERMVRYWEGGYSLPAADRLQSLISLYLARGVFVRGQEATEIRTLWQTVKDMFDANRKRLETYPIFDEGWFAGLFAPATQTETNNNQVPVITKPPPNNLPLESTPLVGREATVAEVKNLLLRPETRLLTLTGMGGTGKTRLSLRVAEELLANFPDGVYFVALASIAQPRQVPAAILRLLDREYTGQTDVSLTVLKGYLYERQMLLVLDNFEHLLAASNTVDELLRHAPKLKILVTSRAVLRLYGEREYGVPPLAVPDVKNLPDAAHLTDYEAIRLFIERAQAVKPNFKLTSENSVAIARICARLDGLPLAIELAAARVRLLTPSALLERLTVTPLEVLAGGARNLLPRQQTIRNTIEWSYNLLNPAEAKLLNRLGVFAGSFTFEAVEAICNADSDLGSGLFETLTGLVEQSLVKQVEGTNGQSRFMLLETVREYALEKLAAHGDLNHMLQDHAAYYRALVATVETQIGLKPNEAESWLQLLEEENDNLLAALADVQPLESNRKYTSHIEFGTFINRPVEEVFAFTTDLEKMPTWSTATENAPVLEGEMKPGGEVRTIASVLGRQVEVKVHIIELEPPRRAVAQNLGGPVTFHILLTCDPVGDGTLLKFTADIESSALFRIVAPIFQPLLRRELEKAVAVLKQLLENGDA